MKLLIFSFLFQFSLNLKLSFGPNDLRINDEPEKLPKLFEGLLKNRFYEIAITLLKTEASDFVPSYCSMWRKADNSELIFRIWDGYFAGEIDANQLNELILPECIASSYFTLINLTDTMIESMPHSLLQVPDFPVRLINPRIVEIALKRAIRTRPHDPRIKWSKWVLNEDVRYPLSSKFYMKFGWQLVSKEDFSSLSPFQIVHLSFWLLYPDAEAFNKLSDEEVLMRTLTLVSWDSSDKLSTAFEALNMRIAARFFGKTLVLALKMMNFEGTKGFPEDLLNIIEALEGFLQNSENVIIGDWFVAILGIWRTELKGLQPNTPRDVEIVQRILNFALNVVDPTFFGISRLPELFDDSFRFTIESAVHDKYAGDAHNILLFYREYPDFFQETFQRVPLRNRFNTFLRQKRVTNSKTVHFSSNSPSVDMRLFWESGPKDFLMFIADRLRNGIDGLSQFSLDPLIGMSYAGVSLSFKNLVKLFLISVNEMSSEWFTPVAGGLIPLPHCPSLMWELLGYFLIQARILKIDAIINFDQEFIVEMMKTPSKEYLQKIIDPFKECKTNDIRLLSMNMSQSFSVASVFPPEEYFPVKDQVIDCKSLVRQLYRKGMISMQLGVNYVLDPFKFTEVEVYHILAPK